MKKAKHNRKNAERITWADGIADFPVGLTMVGLLSIVMGLIFIFS